MTVDYYFCYFAAMIETDKAKQYCRMCVSEANADTVKSTSQDDLTGTFSATDQENTPSVNSDHRLQSPQGLTDSCRPISPAERRRQPSKGLLDIQFHETAIRVGQAPDRPRPSPLGALGTGHNQKDLEQKGNSETTLTALLTLAGIEGEKNA